MHARLRRQRCNYKNLIIEADISGAVIKERLHFLSVLNVSKLASCSRGTKSALIHVEREREGGEGEQKRGRGGDRERERATVIMNKRRIFSKFSLQFSRKFLLD